MPMNGYLAASCIAAGLTEFQKRAQFTGNQHVFEPLMKRCLSEHPMARGTFEDVGKDLSVHQRKYGGKQALTLEEQMVKHPAELVNCDSMVVDLCKHCMNLSALALPQREVEGRSTEAVLCESEVDQPKVCTHSSIAE